MLNSGIYKISCNMNDKYYYGSAKDFDSRWIKHISALRVGNHKNIHLQRAWNKYGKDAFKFEIDMLCPIEKLKQVEQVYLDIYVGRPECFNIATDSSSGMRNRHHSEDSIRKIRIARSKQIITEDHKRAIGNAHRGKIVSLETRKRMSNSNLGKSVGHQHTDETKYRIGLASKGNQYAVGYRHTDEAKSRISQFNKNRIHTSEHNKRVSEAKKGKKFSPEHRQALREAWKLRRNSNVTT